MLTIFYVLLTVQFGRCENNLTVETKTVSVGDDVTLACPRMTSEHRSRLYWIRFVPGDWPEFLGGTYSFNFSGVTQMAHIQVKQEPKYFSLFINKVKQSDAGLYYCIKTDTLNMMFLKGQFLMIRGKEPNITAIIQQPLPDPVHPGKPFSLQCSVLFNSQDKTCPTDHRVYWFQTGSDKSHPSFVYAHANRGNECKISPEDNSGQKCVYTFSKNISASDFGTYYCAVASCGTVLFGNGTKLDVEEPNVQGLQKKFILLYSFLSASLVVICILIYILKRKTCPCCKDGVSSNDNQQINEASLVYTAPTFNRRKTSKTERRNKETSEIVYSGVTG